MANRPLYTELAWAYDLIINKPIERWCGFIHGILQQQGILPGSRVLDAGCGTGEYAIRLGRRGYRVIGLDMSAEMISQGRSKCKDHAGNVQFLIASLLEIPAPPTFDAILCRGVLNDLTSDSDRQRVFPSFAKALRQKGLLILDVRDWERSFISKKAQPVSQRRVATGRGVLMFCSETRCDEESHRLLIRETSELISGGTTRRTSFDLAMRCWTIDELIGSLSTAGFSAIKLLGDYDESIPIGSTDRIIAMARLTA